MSSAEVTSKIQTYWPKISSARPVMLPVSALVATSLSIPACAVCWSMTAAPIAKMSTPARPMTSRNDAQRWPLIVSTIESDESTPTSMRTKRKSIITAPV